MASPACLRPVAPHLFEPREIPQIVLKYLGDEANGDIHGRMKTGFDAATAFGGGPNGPPPAAVSRCFRVRDRGRARSTSPQTKGTVRTASRQRTLQYRSDAVKPGGNPQLRAAAVETTSIPLRSPGGPRLREIRTKQRCELICEGRLRTVRPDCAQLEERE